MNEWVKCIAQRHTTSWRKAHAPTGISQGICTHAYTHTQSDVCRWASPRITYTTFLPSFHTDRSHVAHPIQPYPAVIAPYAILSFTNPATMPLSFQPLHTQLTTMPNTHTYTNTNINARTKRGTACGKRTSGWARDTTYAIRISISSVFIVGSDKNLKTRLILKSAYYMPK